MIAYVFIYVLAILLCLWFIIWHVMTMRRLRKHQREWNKIKAALVKRRANTGEIDDAYFLYSERIMRERSFWGACLPRE